MPERDRAAVHVGLIPVEAEVFLDGEVLRRERLVDLDQVHVANLLAGAVQRLTRGRRGADAHDVRIDTAHTAGDDAGDRLEPRLRGRVGRRDDHRRGAVVDAGSGPGRDGAVLLKAGDELREAFACRIGTDVLVLVHDDVALLLLHLDGNDLLRQAAVLARL